MTRMIRIDGLERYEIRQGVIAVGLFLAVYAAIALLRRHVIARLKLVSSRTADPKLHRLLDDVFDQISGPEAPVIAFFAATRHLELHWLFHRSLTIVVVVLVGYRLIRIAQDAAAFLVRQVASTGEPAARSEEAIQNVVYLTDALLWVVGALLVLGNLGVNVSALITGLGIGGVAVALAAQAILADVFAAVAIFLDRPFVVGDVIALDKDWAGTVERIGFKTTRVRADSGELLIFPNSALTTNKLRNLTAGARQRKA